MSEMEAAAKTFFSSSHFAVAGASQNPNKFGYKLLAWYDSRSLPVQPITPSTSEISIKSTRYSTLASPSELPHPTETSLSIVTQPSITLQILREAKQVGVPAVWLQPGSFDEEGLKYAKKEFKAGIGGHEGHGGEGWCVLVDGDAAIQAAHDTAQEKLNL